MINVTIFTSVIGSCSEKPGGETKESVARGCSADKEKCGQQV